MISKANDRLQWRPILMTLFLLTSLLVAGNAWAFSSGPFDALTNAPGEGNCTQCHSTFALNSGTGSLTVAGWPDPYQAGTMYQLEVILNDPDASRWGFEFTILDTGGNSAGTLAPTDGNTQVTTGGAFGRTYAKQTSAGTNFGQTLQNSWFVDWVAPAAGTGALGFFATGNAANGDFSNSGDRIYASSITAEEEDLSAVPDPSALARMHGNYPNPFNPRTTIRFSLAESAVVSLTVFDLQGRRVDVLHAGNLEEGTHQVDWSGADRSGRELPSGTYFALLTDRQGRQLGLPLKMTLAK